MSNVRRSLPSRSLVLVLVFATACDASGGGAPTTRPEGTTPQRGAVVRISEVMYHDPLEDATQEFVELANIGDQDAQLQGWCLDGAGFCFTEAVTLPAGGFVVVRQDEMTGRLANSDDHLVLIDALGQSVDEIDYTDTDPWPSTADGGGTSLQRLETFAAGVDRASWVDAPPTPLGPLVTDAALPAGDIAITEIHYHAVDDNPAATFVELTNVSGAVVDIEGWCLVGGGHCVETPQPIAAGASVVLSGVFSPDSLSWKADRLRVVEPSGRVHDTAVYEDAGGWPALADGHGMSLHRRNTSLSGEEPGNWDAAAPTPGAAVVDDTALLLPTFDSLEFTTSPEPGAPISVAAEVADAEAVSLVYVVGFGEPVTVPATMSDGIASAAIPGQAAGALVRFQMVATAGAVTGTWPRSGDGSTYTGTVVADPAAEPSALTRVQLFMPDDVYDEAYSTTTLQGNEGFPVVVASDGVVFDNALIRVKGNQARSNRKRKWKVMLPAGHEWDAGGAIEAPIDQFDLLPAATDKSYSREVLVSDMQELSGGYAQQVFPVRVELNGEFYGLYLYGESPDGEWRDRQGLSDDTYVWKIDGVTKLRVSDLNATGAEYRRKFERITMTYVDDGDLLLRGLIAALDDPSDEAVVRFAYEHFDIPQVIEALATMRVVQHSEWQHKNHYVMFDPVDERWRFVPIDFDLTFGRYYHSPCNALCDEVVAQPYTDYMNGNMFTRVLLEHEPFRSMVDRRTRTLAEQYLAPGVLEARLAELLGWMQSEAALDRSKWGQYGLDQTMDEAQRVIVEQFLAQKRRYYLESAKYLPASQPGEPRLGFESVVREGDVVVSARLVNLEAVAIDVSNREFAEIGAVMPAGAVVPAGGAISIVFERAPVTPGGVLEVQVLASRLEPG